MRAVKRRPLVLPLDLLVQSPGVATVGIDGGEPRLQEAGLRSDPHLPSTASNRAGEEVDACSSQSQGHSTGFCWNWWLMIPGRQ